MRSIRIRKSTIKNAMYCILLFIGIGEQYVAKVMFNKVFSLIPFGINGTTAMYVMFGLLYLCVLPEVFLHLVQKKAYDVLFILCFFCIQLILFGVCGWSSRITNQDERMERLFFFLIPLYILSRSITDYDKFSSWVRLSSYLVFFFCIGVIGSGSRQVMTQQGYETSMVLGYQVGLCALVWFDVFFNRRYSPLFRRVHLVMGILALIFVVLRGSRGTLLCIAVYFLFIAMDRAKHAPNNKWKLLCVLGMFLVTLVLYFFWENIVIAAISLVERKGIQSRTIAWLLGTDLSLDSSGRDYLYSRAISLIIENPFGYGILADRELLGMYVHNLFLELMMEYGYIVGGFFSIAVLSHMKKALTSENTRAASPVIVMAIVQLFVSGSYLHNTLFWLALGAMWSAVQRKENA